MMIMICKNSPWIGTTSRDINRVVAGTSFDQHTGVVRCRFLYVGARSATATAVGTLSAIVAAACSTPEATGRVEQHATAPLTITIGIPLPHPQDVLLSAT